MKKQGGLKEFIFIVLIINSIFQSAVYGGFKSTIILTIALLPVMIAYDMFGLGVAYKKLRAKMKSK